MAHYFHVQDTSYTYAMKKYLFTGVLTLLVLSSVYAQKKQKQTFQYSPGRNKKAISGVITEVKSTYMGDQKLSWVFIGDTVIHVWDKDMKKEIAVGKMFTFNGIQKLAGVKKYLEKQG